MFRIVNCELCFCPPLEEVARSAGGGLSLVLLQTRVYFSILYIIHPPPTGTPSKGRQKVQPNCPPLGEVAP